MATASAAVRHKKRKKRAHLYYDYELMISVIFLCLFGLIMIYSASSYTAQLTYEKSWYYVQRQAVFELVGFAAMLVVSKLDYHRLRKWAVPLYFLCYVLMFLLLFTPLGVSSHGKKRWLRVGVQFQPTELIKIALILLTATILDNLGTKINDWRRALRLILYCMPLILLVTKNNLSSGIIIAGIIFIMLFVVVEKSRWFYLLFGLMLAMLFLAPKLSTLLVRIGLLKEYQLGRILVWVDPVKYAKSGGYQVLQGLYAVGSGGFFGKGLGQSLQKLGFVPEAQNDMIFSILCEELGLFGAFCMIAMFLFLIFRFVKIAQNAPDLFGSMLVIGIMAQIAIQVILNIAVVANVIPNTGVTLPFISYGGTSVALLLFEMGIALSVSNQISPPSENREE
ncbi:FtsW/RodA/SpoVE family cell cycle protein [Clostridium vitabionis]|jgi:cell division protein FtsW|uniref:FtsW/RodA/SpoVE family cell cycle protein n=1 Tax=Clostridium vitabionis TaxID=2784388 RepID=UPI00188D59E3|nr:putative peptidoglycan glycosyltransferase FtsW [Clostridium vitabionis]